MACGIRFAAAALVAVAASLALSGPRLSGSVMFAGRVPWDAMAVLVLVGSVCAGAVYAAPARPGVLVVLAGLGCLSLGSTSQLFLLAGVVLLLVAAADAGLQAAAGP